MMLNITIHEIINDIFGEDSRLIIDTIRNREVRLSEVSEIHNFITECIAETLQSKISGSHRKGDWESGWSGKGIYNSDSEYDNLPYYFKKNTHVRYNNNVYRDESGFVEYDLLKSLQSFVFRKFANFDVAQTLFEFGCGTGSNITTLKKIFPNVAFHGGDWAKSAVDNLVKLNIVGAKAAHRVDYFDPSTYPIIQQKYIAFTNASLEQAGADYHEFIDFLINDQNCVQGIHIEPIKELLDLSCPLNVQSYYYSEKRNYLTSFVNYLNNKDINIVYAKDHGIGSKYINGYQVVVWEKI